MKTQILILAFLILNQLSVAQSTTGCIEGDCQNGKGTFIYSKGSYIGEFKNSKRHGQGTLTLPSGKKYIGEFKYGKYDGFGKSYDSTGTLVKEGYFYRGVYVGEKIAEYDKAINDEILKWGKEYTLINEAEYKVKYLFSVNAVKFIIETKGSPSIIIDANQNLKRDENDKSYGLSSPGNLCYQIYHNDYTSSTCGQFKTNATLTMEDSKYVFEIPLIEMNSNNSSEYFVIFSNWNGKDDVIYPMGGFNTPYKLSKTISSAVTNNNVIEGSKINSSYKWVSIADTSRKFEITKTDNDLNIYDIKNNTKYLFNQEVFTVVNWYNKANMALPSKLSYRYDEKTESGHCYTAKFHYIFLLGETKFKWDYFSYTYAPDNYSTCFEVLNYKDFGTLVPDLSNELKSIPSTFSKYNLIFRDSKEYGKIASDYVPPVYSSYNAGRKYTFEGSDGEEFTLQEKDYKTYVKEGNYTSDILGYKYIFQIINKSQKNYLISYKLTGTSKMSDIVRDKSWFTFNNYKTTYEYNDFDFANTFILKPDSSYKENLIVGVNFPPNLNFETLKINEVSNEWITGLNKALTGIDTINIKKYIDDPLAKSWQTNIQNNLVGIRTSNQKNYFSKVKPLVTAKINVVDPTTYDVSFNSDVKISIQNKSLDNISVTYETPFGTYTGNVNANSVFEKVHSIKGVEKSSLIVEITNISKQ